MHHLHALFHLNELHIFPLTPPGINIGLGERGRRWDKKSVACVAVDGMHFTILKPGGPRGMSGAFDRQYKSGARFFPSTVWTNGFFFDF